MHTVPSLGLLGAQDAASVPDADDREFMRRFGIRPDGGDAVLGRRCFRSLYARMAGFPYDLFP